jgi:hypothetical protein
MSWPLASHFSTMLQTPRVAFRDAQLQRCAIEKNDRNQPRPWAGQFAVVYKGIDPDRGPFAIRIFTTESPERRERYDLISAYLKGRKLKCLVDFEYRDRSIRSAGDGKWYPLILMDWVQGDTLYQWVRARCLEGNGAAVAYVADRWLEAVKELEDAQVAHGDLQHANVMVTPAGEVKLVDYDGMCVPALVGRRNLEVGVDPYQHPERNPRTLLSLDLDNFSALVIYVALRAIALNPGLWLKYVEQPGYDKLLFRREDFQAPQHYPLYHDLIGLGGAEFRDLVEQLFVFARSPMDQVPPLVQTANSYGKIEQLLSGRQWHAAVELLNRRGHFRDAPEHLRPLIREAYEYVCREEAWAAFVKIPPEASEQVDRQLIEGWNEPLFAGFPPAEQERMRVAEARRRVMLVDRLRQIAQQIAGKMSLAGEKSLAAGAAQLPQGYKFSLRERVDLARRRMAALVRLDRLLRDPVSEAAILTAWKGVVAAGCEQFVGIETGMRIALAEERAPLIRALAAIPADLPADQYDRRIVKIWREDLLDQCREAKKWRGAYKQAELRRKAVKRLRAAIEAQDDAAILRLTQHPSLQGYPLPDGCPEALQAAQDRQARLDVLLAALRDGQPSPFREAFDARLVRQFAPQFAPSQALLTQWVRTELLSAEKLGLQPPADQPPLLDVDEPEGNCRVRWTWPEERFADQCILAICPAEPATDENPEKATAHWRATVGRKEYEAAGGSWLVMVDRAWQASCVVVWAVVDLGTEKLYSRPLVLGTIEPKARRKWKGLRLFSRREEATETENTVEQGEQPAANK